MYGKNHPYALGDRVQMITSLPEDRPSTLDGRTGTVTEMPFESPDGSLVGVKWDNNMGNGNEAEEDYELSQFLQYEDFFQ